MVALRGKMAYGSKRVRISCSNCPVRRRKKSILHERRAVFVEEADTLLLGDGLFSSFRRNPKSN